MEKSRLVDVSLFLIRLYRAASALGAPCCRFYPTCSAFAHEALLRYGFWGGVRRATVRILKCHPFHSGGYDPLTS